MNVLPWGVLSFSIKEPSECLKLNIKELVIFLHPFFSYSVPLAGAPVNLLHGKRETRIKVEEREGERKGNQQEKGER